MGFPTSWHLFVIEVNWMTTSSSFSDLLREHRVTETVSTICTLSLKDTVSYSEVVTIYFPSVNLQNLNHHNDRKKFYNLSLSRRDAAYLKKNSAKAQRYVRFHHACTHVIPNHFNSNNSSFWAINLKEINAASADQSQVFATFFPIICFLQKLCHLGVEESASSLQPFTMTLYNEKWKVEVLTWYYTDRWKKEIYIYIYIYKKEKQHLFKKHCLRCRHHLQFSSYLFSSLLTIIRFLQILDVLNSFFFINMDWN